MTWLTGVRQAFRPDLHAAIVDRTVGIYAPAAAPALDSHQGVDEVEKPGVGHRTEVRMMQTS